MTDMQPPFAAEPGSTGDRADHPTAEQDRADAIARADAERARLDPAAAPVGAGGGGAGDVRLADTAADDEVCPTCGADDANPSNELLPHCWRCGYRGDNWPPADMGARSRARADRLAGIVG